MADDVVSIIISNHFIFLYAEIFFFSWVYPAEIFPLASRAKGTAMATVAFSLAGGLINEIVPYLIDAIGFWVFILFALVNLAMLVPIYLFYIGMPSPSHTAFASEQLLISDDRNGRSPPRRSRLPLRQQEPVRLARGARLC